MTPAMTLATTGRHPTVRLGGGVRHTSRACAAWLYCGFAPAAKAR
ncbi:MAG: hypothetical protein RID91_15495 [Azospirillaceae bacterium]